MKWSLSRLGTFESCNAKYEFKYLKKVPEGEKNKWASRGIDNHRLIELYLRSEIPELAFPLDFYTEFLNSLKQKENYPEFKISLKEDLTPCDWDDPDVWYQGILDLVAIDGEAGLVYDWKTGKIYDDHQDQRDIYALATFARFPQVQEVSAFHVYLDSNQTRKSGYARNQVPAMWEPWRRRVKFLEQATVFIPNPGFHCRNCPFSRSKGGPCRF